MNVGRLLARVAKLEKSAKGNTVTFYFADGSSHTMSDERAEAAYFALYEGQLTPDAEIVLKATSQSAGSGEMAALSQSLYYSRMKLSTTN